MFHDSPRVRSAQDFASEMHQGQVRRSGEPYLTHVMRQKVGDVILLFNGQNGEWLAEIDTVTKKTRSEEEGSRLHTLWVDPTKREHAEDIPHKRQPHPPEHEARYSWQRLEVSSCLAKIKEKTMVENNEWK